MSNLRGERRATLVSGYYRARLNFVAVHEPFRPKFAELIFTQLRHGFAPLADGPDSDPENSG